MVTNKVKKLISFFIISILILFTLNSEKFEKEYNSNGKYQIIDETVGVCEPIIEYDYHYDENYEITYIYYEQYAQLIILYILEEWHPFRKDLAEFRILCAKNNFIINEKHRWYRIREIYRNLRHHADGKQILTVRCTLSM